MCDGDDERRRHYLNFFSLLFLSSIIWLFVWASRQSQMQQKRRARARALTYARTVTLGQKNGGEKEKTSATQRIDLIHRLLLLPFLSSSAPKCLFFMVQISIFSSLFIFFFFIRKREEERTTEEKNEEKRGTSTCMLVYSVCSLVPVLLLTFFFLHFFFQIDNRLMVIWNKNADKFKSEANERQFQRERTKRNVEEKNRREKRTSKN